MLLTVLYDARCPLCTRFGDWLARQPLLVPVELVPAGSARARDRFPLLDHARTLREVTVVSDAGALWRNEAAWVVCLWATAPHRGLAERLARPAWQPVARAAALAGAGLRAVSTTASPAGGGDYGAACAGTCPAS